MNNGPQRTVKTIRIFEDAYHQARIAAVTSRMSLGQWFEEAISEKLAREGTVPPTAVSSLDTADQG